MKNFEEAKTLLEEAQAKGLGLNLKDFQGHEWMVCTRDGIHADAENALGNPVSFEGRTGKVVLTTKLFVLVRWDDWREETNRSIRREDLICTIAVVLLVAITLFVGC